MEFNVPTLYSVITVNAYDVYRLHFLNEAGEINWFHTKSDKLPDNTVLFNKAKEQIKNYTKKYGISESEFYLRKVDANNKEMVDANGVPIPVTDAKGNPMFDYQTAISAAIRNKMENERQFIKGYASTSSTSPTYIADVRTRMATAGIWDEKGNVLTGDAAKKVIQAFTDDKKQQILDVAYHPFTDGPANAVVVDGKVYLTRMDDYNASFLRNESMGIKSLYEGNNVANIVGDNVVISKFNRSGNQRVYSTVGYGSGLGQASLAKYYEAEVKKLVNIGMSDAAARDYMQSHGGDIDADIIKSGKHTATYNGKSTDLTSAVHFDNKVYYGSKLSDSKTPIWAYHDAIVGQTMTSFSDPFQNVFYKFFAQPILRSKALTATQFGGVSIGEDISSSYEFNQDY